MSFCSNLRSCAQTCFYRLLLVVAMSAIGLGAWLVYHTPATAFAQGQQNKTQNQTDLSASQRLGIMRSKLDSMRRSLNSAISAIPAKENADKNKAANPDDPREVL